MAVGRAVGLAVGLAVFGACAKQSDVSTVDLKLSQLEKQVGELQTRVNDLETVNKINDMLRNDVSVAYLTPGNSGYTVVQMDLGNVTVRLVDVQPYANGSRVTLQIGNPSAATINDVKGELEWGSVDGKGIAVASSMKQREVTFDRSLRAGSWTNLQFVLEGVLPKDLGFVQVKRLHHGGISLAR